MHGIGIVFFFFFQAEDGIRDVERSRGLGDVYKRQDYRGIWVGWTVWATVWNESRFPGNRHP